MPTSSTPDHTIPYVPAVASWYCSAQESQNLLGYGSPTATTRAHFELSLGTSDENKASFRFRLLVDLRALKGKRVHVFFCIPPDRILDIQGHTDNVPNSIRTGLLFAKEQVSSNSIVSMRFCLSSPGTVILPRVSDLAPSSQSAGRVLELLESLVRSTEFTIFFKEKSNTLRDKVLETFCRRDWTSTVERVLDVETLYAGHGAKTVQAADFSLSAREVPVESPPSYDELAPTPPPAHGSSSPPRKKLRQAPPTDSVKQPLAPHDDLERTLAEMSARLSQQFRKEMHENLDRLETRVKADMETRMKAAMETRMRADMAEHVVRIERLVEERLVQLKEETSDDIDLAQDQTRDEVEVSLDDRMTLIKDEVMDYVRDEIRDVEDRIRRDLSQATVSFEF
ncbi:hypothetical protein B0J12DRAFT_747733 [Macrophomina phaseolina]|uniref:Uncharacterized protein n=1 Tax=Macrophomina phaseolina TaxID=35725 RepID=A0ABQ8FPG6_9PEZI|nr:hypothetical protein B0J12DRAFT_747733 [Macrophomina phaseolina]